MEEEIKLRIERTEEILKRGEGRDKRAYIAVLDLLRKDYESINNRERAKEISREIIEYIERNKKEIEGEETGEYMRNAYDTLARNGDFEAFMIAMEWNRPIKSQFYLPRRRVLKKHGFIQGIQDLLDRKIKMLVIEAPPGIGKAQPLDTDIVTKEGYKKMGDLKVGDMVACRDGSFAPITHIFEQGIKPVYRVTFSDETSTICCKEHLWTTQTKEDRRRKRYRTIELEEIMAKYKRTTYSIDYCEPVQFNKKELKINPYLLGVMIGDGCLTHNTVQISNPEKEIFEKVCKCLPKGDKATHSNGVINISREEYNCTKSETMKSVIECGLHGCRSYEKEIPEEYLLSDIEDRVKLLQGLVDTDGYVKGCGVEYTTTSEKLSKQVVFLVQSLGGRAKIIKRRSSYRDKNGKKVECRDKYRIFISFSNDIVPCSSEKHLKKYRKVNKYGKKYIKNIEYLKDTECRCIMINHAEHLYLTNDFIVTHNSVMGEFAFAYQYVMHPERKSLMGGNANMLVTGFYQDILDFLTNPEYRFKEIFPNFPKIEYSAEYKMVYTERKKREPNLMFVSIEVGATGIIHVDGMLYVDDLIKTAEQANNPEQCQKIRYAYTGMLQDRLVNADVPILVIGTMWSINDHISYLKTKYGQEEWFRGISVPCMNEAHTESNFMYDFGQEKTVEHWERLIRDDDEIIAMAKFFCIAMDREGRLFNTDNFNYFSELPSGEPDHIVGAVDVAFGGGDNYSMPIAYVYGREVYIADVIYTKQGIKYSRPMTVAKIAQHNISKLHFEANNGGEIVAQNIEGDCKEQGIICNITWGKVPTTKTKLDRILAVSSQIAGTDDNANTFKLYYLTPKKQTLEYKKFMSCIKRFSQSLDIQGKQEDDAPDSLANLISNVLGKTRYAKVTSSISRREMGI